MKKIDEKELHDIFEQFKEGDANAYNVLYEKYNTLVYGIAFSVMKNKEDTEDVVSEVFTKIYKLDKEKLPVASEASWLFTVTRNECFTNLRKKKQYINIDEVYEIGSNSKEIENIINSDYYNNLIKGLSEQEKTIISLKVISGFTFNKISQMLNIPIGTVQWKYYKAINSLKISIGSLVGAMLAFVLVFARREQLDKDKIINKGSANKENNSSVNNKFETANEDTVNKIEENNNMSISSGISNSKNDESSSTSSSYIENSLYSIDSEDTENSKIDGFSIAGITIGIIFLITFIIFFIKFQQKHLKKKSKQC